MQSINGQLISNRELLSDLMHEGRIDAPTATAHIASGELLAASGILLELRVAPQLTREFKVELSGILSVERA